MTVEHNKENRKYRWNTLLIFITTTKHACFWLYETCNLPIMVRQRAKQHGMSQHWRKPDTGYETLPTMYEAAAMCRCKQSLIDHWDRREYIQLEDARYWKHSRREATDIKHKQIEVYCGYNTSVSSRSLCAWNAKRPPNNIITYNRDSKLHRQKGRRSPRSRS